MTSRYWWQAATPLMLVLFKLQNSRITLPRLRIGTSSAVSGGVSFDFHYRGELTWSVHRQEVYVGTIFLEDWTHYSYILPGNEPLTGPETSTSWRITLRALAAA